MDCYIVNFVFTPIEPINLNLQYDRANIEVFVAKSLGFPCIYMYHDLNLFKNGPHQSINDHFKKKINMTGEHLWIYYYGPLGRTRCRSFNKHLKIVFQLITILQIGFEFEQIN